MPISARLPSSSSSRHTMSWLILIGANVAWATSYVAAKYALSAMSLPLMLALRMCISGAVLLPFLLARRASLHLTWRDIPQLALLSLIGFVVNKMLEFGGLSLTTASDVALLITGESIFTSALSWIVLREHVSARSVGALALGFIGVYLIVERSLLPSIPAGGGIWRMVGDLLVIGALMIEALYTVRGKALLARHSPLLITTASIVGSMVFWLPVAGWEFLSTGWRMPDLFGWLSVLWLAIMCTCIAYLAWFQGLTKVKASAAASTLFIQPLLGPLLGVLLLHEELTPYTIFGGMLIIVSVYLISKQE
ncbi:DMT family transporter [Dictyobacter kobayashii]|uniref:Multidrug transporter n=1 Tax=Dictyobacter kobayashii TaxID=2014872 RepID=A0A402AHS3_9CHLR|nr:DMT family transporter [Dictyobacter kobayashii]GCE18605.1 multidrug transporter [Dictyobacter kobayashii]